MDSRYLKTATAVEPIMTLFKVRGIKYPSVTIFDDGSGYLSVPFCARAQAVDLLITHGADLGRGYRDSDKTLNWCFDLELGKLEGFRPSHCPHCQEVI